ncbi:hypothetical protein LguiA_004473 [Lonicera macranthoides]
MVLKCAEALSRTGAVTDFGLRLLKKRDTYHTLYIMFLAGINHNGRSEEFLLIFIGCQKGHRECTHLVGGSAVSDGLYGLNTVEEVFDDIVVATGHSQPRLPSIKEGLSKIISKHDRPRSLIPEDFIAWLEMSSRLMKNRNIFGCVCLATVVNVPEKGAQKHPRGDNIQDSSIGFGAPVRANMRPGGVTHAFVMSSLLETVESSDLIAYGANRAQKCTTEVVPKDVSNEWSKIFFSSPSLQVKLQFVESALRLIARKATSKNTGARGLRAILENTLMVAMYECYGSVAENTQLWCVLEDLVRVFLFSIGIWNYRY